MSSTRPRAAKREIAAKDDYSDLAFFHPNAELEQLWADVRRAMRGLNVKQQKEALCRVDITGVSDALQKVTRAFRYQKRIPTVRTQSHQIHKEWLIWVSKTWPEEHPVRQLNAVKSGVANRKFMSAMARYYLQEHSETFVSLDRISLKEVEGLSLGQAHVLARSRVKYSFDSCPRAWLSRIFQAYLEEESSEDYRAELDYDVQLLSSMSRKRRRSM